MFRLFARLFDFTNFDLFSHLMNFNVKYTVNNGGRKVLCLKFFPTKNTNIPKLSEKGGKWGQ